MGNQTSKKVQENHAGKNNVTPLINSVTLMRRHSNSLVNYSSQAKPLLAKNGFYRTLLMVH